MKNQIIDEEFSVVTENKFEEEISVERVDIPIKEIYKNFKDTEEGGTWAYNDKLNIRPAFQREFVYEGKDLTAVIESVLRGFPLSLMYWGTVKDSEGKIISYEMIDGQQRTLSIMKFINNEFTIYVDDTPYNFEDLDDDLKERIWKYKLEIAIISGTSRNKLKYFQIINTHGKKLNDQELLNAAHNGMFVTGARKNFSNKNSEFFTSVGMGGNWTNFLKRKNADIKRQDVLERVLTWVVGGNKKDIADYLAENRNEDSSILTSEVLKILTWAKETFAPKSKNYKDWMVDVDWGEVYYVNDKLEEKKLTKDVLPNTINEIEKLISDEDVTREVGIPMYLVTGEEKHLSIRSFTLKEKTSKWKEQNKKCAYCGKNIELKDSAADHKEAWVDGGKTELDNLQILCVKCNSSKGSKKEAK